MPVVPKYNGQVQTQALSNVRISDASSLEAFGGGQSLDRLTSAGEKLASQYAQEERDKANQLKMLEKRRALNNWEHVNIYDPQTGAVSKKGKDALGINDELTKNYDKFLSEQEKDLTDEQKVSFEQLAESRREHIMGWADNHVAQQISNMESDEYGASLESSKERASTDPANAAMESTFIQQQATLRGKSQGWGPEKIAQEIQKNQSDLHARVVNKMLSDNNDVGAQKYFDSVKGTMDPDIAVKVKSALEEGSLRGESQRASDKIMSKGKNMSDSLEEARAIKDPKLRDQTVTRIRQRFSLDDEARRDNIEKLGIQAANIIDQSGSFDKVPPEMVTNMPLSMRSSLQAYARKKALGEEPATNWTEYYDLKSLASAPETKQKFLKTNLMEYRDKLGNTEFKELVNLQSSLRKSDQSADAHLDGYRTDTQIIDDALLSMKIKPHPKPGSDDAKKIAEFHRAVDVQVAAYAKAHGKKPSNEEVQGIVDNLMVKGITGKKYFGLASETKSLFELTPDDTQFKVSSEDIPDGERQKIEAALKSRGIAVTEDKVIQLYGLKLRKMVQRGR